jgi:putative tricarboxylic transport membrane protein
MRTGEVATGLALLACAVFFAWRALLLPFGTVGLPGPGFFPFALAIVLGVLALAIVLYAVRDVDALETIFLGHRDVLVAIGALIGVAIAFERGDTYLVLGTFTVVMLVTVGRTQWWRAVLGAALGMVAVWAVFSRALGVRLPVSPIWGFLAGTASVATPF